MFALRTLARRAPRSALSLTSRPATTSFTAASRFIARPQTLAAFSTSRIARDEYAQHLAVELAQEIETESEEASAGSDSNVEFFRNEHPEWDYSGDVAGSQDVFLTREYEGDERVTVYFSIADFNNNMYEDDMDQALGDEEDMETQSGGGNTKGAINQGRTAGGNFKQAPEDSVAPGDREELADEEDEPQPQPYPVAVNVLIQRKSVPGALKFLLNANENAFFIEQLIHIPANLGSDAKELAKTTPTSIYAGPPFQQLDEEMQGTIEQYLNARGITNELAGVIADWVDVKEQKEYLGWLGRVKEFVD